MYVFSCGKYYYYICCVLSFFSFYFLNAYRHKLPTNQGVKAYLLPQQKSADTKQKADVLSQSRQNIPRPSHINRRHKIPRVESSTYQNNRFRLPQPPVIRSRTAFSRAVKTFFDKSASRYKNFQGGITIPTIFGLTQSSTKDEPKDRIFNGWELPPHEFPWMVKLKVMPYLFLLIHSDGYVLFKFTIQNIL